MYMDIPLGTTKFTTRNARQESGSAIPTGVGELTLYNAETQATLTGATWPLAHTWNAVTLRYETPLADSAILIRAEGQVIRAELKITWPDGTIYRRKIRGRVRG